MPIEIRPVTAAEYPEFFRAIVRGFGDDPPKEDPQGEGLQRVLPPERTVAAFDGARIVGTLGDYDLTVYLPGGALIPMAGTTVVTVASTHRRRGLLRSMMEYHLDAAVARGDPVAGLWASETPIYGRFGFGCAADGIDYEFEADQIVISPPEDVSLELLAEGEAIDVLPEVFAAVARRPGVVPRTREWWEQHSLRDLPSQRHGRSAHRHVVATRDGERVGYATYRLKQQWEDLPDGKVVAHAVFAADTAVRRALVSHLASVDLYPNVSIWNQPVDDPLVWEVADRRRLQRHISDSLWVRVLDVPAALTARRYETDGRILIGVSDPTRPDNDGVYELAVEEGAATVTRSSDDPHVEVGVDVLGALLMGGRNAVELHRAGLVAGGRPETVRLDRMFRTAAAPWCPEVF